MCVLIWVIWYLKSEKTSEWIVKTQGWQVNIWSLQQTSTSTLMSINDSTFMSTTDYSSTPSLSGCFLFFTKPIIILCCSISLFVALKITFKVCSTNKSNLYRSQMHAGFGRMIERELNQWENVMLNFNMECKNSFEENYLLIFLVAVIVIHFRHSLHLYTHILSIPKE